MDAAISVRGLSVRYGEKTAIDGVSLTVPKGEVFGFIGPNGAGKSTFIKAVLGLIFPRSGSISLNGKPPSDPTSRRKIGFLPEEANYYRFLTPLEALSFYGSICGLTGKALRVRSEELLNFVGLRESQNKRIGTFSKGMAQKMSLAQALINDPETLILDEPTSGLDPLAKANLRDLLLDLKKKGKTIFFSSHELSEVELLCDGIAIIKGGKIVASGAIRQVLGGADQNLEKLFVRLVRGEN